MLKTFFENIFLILILFVLLSIILFVTGWSLVNFGAVGGAVALILSLALTITILDLLP